MAVLLSGCVDAFISVTVGEGGLPTKVGMREVWDLEALRAQADLLEEPHNADDTIMVAIAYPERVTDELFEQLTLAAMPPDLIQAVSDGGARLVVELRTQTETTATSAVTVDLTGVAADQRMVIVGAALEGAGVDVSLEVDNGQIRFAGSRSSDPTFTSVESDLGDIDEDMLFVLGASGLSFRLEVVFPYGVTATNGLVAGDGQTVRWNLLAANTEFTATAGTPMATPAVTETTAANSTVSEPSAVAPTTTTSTKPPPSPTTTMSGLRVDPDGVLRPIQPATTTTSATTSTTAPPAAVLPPVVSTTRPVGEQVPETEEGSGPFSVGWILVGAGAVVAAGLIRRRMGSRRDSPPDTDTDI